MPNYPGWLLIRYVFFPESDNAAYLENSARYAAQFANSNDEFIAMAETAESDSSLDSDEAEFSSRQIMDPVPLLKAYGAGFG